jgi:hypothetical protein
MKRDLSLLDHLESLEAGFSVNDEEALPLPLESMLSEIQKRVMKLGLVGKGVLILVNSHNNCYATPALDMQSLHRGPLR